MILNEYHKKRNEIVTKQVQEQKNLNRNVDEVREQAKKIREQKTNNQGKEIL